MSNYVCAICRGKIKADSSEEHIVLNDADYPEVLKEYKGGYAHERCMMWYYDYNQG